MALHEAWSGGGVRRKRQLLGAAVASGTARGLERMWHGGSVRGRGGRLSSAGARSVMADLAAAERIQRRRANLVGWRRDGLAELMTDLRPPGGGRGGC